jgi:hypothetical protein
MKSALCLLIGIAKHPSAARRAQPFSLSSPPAGQGHLCRMPSVTQRRPLVRLVIRVRSAPPHPVPQHARARNGSGVDALV